MFPNKKKQPNPEAETTAAAINILEGLQAEGVKGLEARIEALKKSLKK